MAKYIDADNLLHSLPDDLPYKASVKRVLMQAVESDVVEVRHGEWIEDGYNDIPCACSHCGAEAHYVSTFNETFDYDYEENLYPTGYEETKEYTKTSYCPNCGAKMDGGGGMIGLGLKFSDDENRELDLQKSIEFAERYFGAVLDKVVKHKQEEAVKEFAEKLKEKRKWDIDMPDYVLIADIDNLVAEMTEGKGGAK